MGCLVGTFYTEPTEDKVLFNFYKNNSSFRRLGKFRKQLPNDILIKINEENKRDIIATFFAVPWQIVLFNWNDDRTKAVVECFKFIDPPCSSFCGPLLVLV